MMITLTKVPGGLLIDNLERFLIFLDLSIYTLILFLINIFFIEIWLRWLRSMGIDIYIGFSFLKSLFDIKFGWSAKQFIHSWSLRSFAFYHPKKYENKL